MIPDSFASPAAGHLRREAMMTGAMPRVAPSSEADPWTCEPGLDSRQVRNQWSSEKQVWCCYNRQLGCLQGGPSRLFNDGRRGVMTGNRFLPFLGTITFCVGAIVLLATLLTTLQRRQSGRLIRGSYSEVMPLAEEQPSTQSPRHEQHLTLSSRLHEQSLTLTPRHVPQLKRL